jgi:hypothetical protein
MNVNYNTELYMGDVIVFTFRKTEYIAMLAQVGFGEGQLISLQDGNRWGESKFEYSLGKVKWGHILDTIELDKDIMTNIKKVGSLPNWMKWEPGY